MQRKRAFTLVELLVVITIIGIISSLVVVSFNSSRVKARDNKRISDANLIASALGQYYTSNLRSYPLPGAAGSSSTYSSVNLNTAQANFVKTALSSYLNPVPVDTNTNYAYYYVYRNDGKRAVVAVLGLEGGTAKCNIISGDTNMPPALSDPATGLLKTKPNACYYVSL